MPTQEIFDRIQEDARRRMSRRQAEGSNLFIQKSVIRSGRAIKTPQERIAMELDTLLVFSDDAPAANWAHPCRYLLYNAENGEMYKEVPARFPPYLVKVPETYEVFHQAVTLAPDWTVQYIKPQLHYAWKLPLGTRFAVLFSGASNFRHVNDLEFAYRTLVDVYGFSPSNIYVLNYDGSLNWSGAPFGATNWPGDGTPHRMTINGAGTKADLEGVLGDLKTRLHSDDLLLIHTNNHGGHNGTESYLCTYSGASYKASDFAAKLGQLPEFRCLIAMFEQCHSGGFNSHVIGRSPATRTSVASACSEFDSSWGNGHFDYFARDWIAAINGIDPYGAALASNPDSNADGCIGAREAYDYANTYKYAADTPVYSQAPAGAGECHLGQLWYWWWPWWYKQVLYERPLLRRPPLPDPELYERIHHSMMPELEEIDRYVAERYMKLGKELEEEIGPRVEELIDAALG